jgi:hypothetical protein
MRREPYPKTRDSNSERVKEKQEGQSAKKSLSDQQPLKEHGQPAWREVKPGE